MAYKKNFKKETNSEEVKQDKALDILISGVESVMKNYTQFLKLKAQLKNHSWGNTILEFIQAMMREDKGKDFKFTFKGKDQWAKLGRTVKEGELDKAIQIYAPKMFKASRKPKFDLTNLNAGEQLFIQGHVSKKMYENKDYGIYAVTLEKVNGEDFSGYLNIAGNIAKDITLYRGYSIRGEVGLYKGLKQLKAEDNGVKEIELTNSYNKSILTGFTFVDVYDYSQCEGEEIPNLSICNPIKAENEISNDIVTALHELIDIPVSYEDTGKSNGYFVPVVGSERIAIKNTLGTNHKAKTFIHESMHYRLHQDKLAKKLDLSKLTNTVVDEYAVEEIIVESVAFIVCNYFGIDVEDYSFEYVLSWSSGDVEQIKKVGNLIQKYQTEMIDKLSEQIGLNVEASEEELEIAVA